jgi:hypothetical protein
MAGITINPANILNGDAADETLINVLTAIPERLSFNPEDWSSLGLQDSHKYREQFLKIATNARLTGPQIFYAIMAAVAVKNRDRILKSLGVIVGNPDITAVCRFFKDNCVQYVPQSSPTKFPVVKIPESFPSVALVASIAIWGRVEEAAREPVLKKIKEQLFFGQMKISAEMQNEHMEWERDVFWGTSEDTGLVRSSKFDRRPKSIKLEFNTAFYETKANDKYPFLSVDGLEVDFAAEEPTNDELWDYIKDVKEVMVAKR